MEYGTNKETANVPRIVIAGGGIAALEAVLALRALAADRVDIDVWTPEQDFVDRAQSVAVPFSAGEVRRFPVDRLVTAAGGTLRHGRVLAVDPGRRVISTDIGEVPYDALMLALGAESRPSLNGALTFSGPEDVDALTNLLDSVVTSPGRRLVFVLPAAPTRHLPLYELALGTRNYLSDRGTQDVTLTVVTAESSPFAHFGPEAGNEIRDLLAERAIQLFTSAAATGFVEGNLQLSNQPPIQADGVVAMARLDGPRIPGVPCDPGGFVSVDSHCRVVGLEDVYAVGDMTTFPVRHGGIACEQADAAAEMIAATIGVSNDPAPFHPVMRIQLLTGMFPRYLRLEEGEPLHTFSTQAPWSPATKVVGRYITPFLAKHLGLSPAVDVAEVPREIEILPHAGLSGPS